MELCSKGSNGAEGFVIRTNAERRNLFVSYNDTTSGQIGISPPDAWPFQIEAPTLTLQSGARRRHVAPKRRARKTSCGFRIGARPMIVDVAREAPRNAFLIERAKPLERQIVSHDRQFDASLALTDGI